ncbi:MAG: cobalamin-dependent protein [Anaerolineales bacterium]
MPDILAELRSAYLKAMTLGSGRSADQVVEYALASEVKADALYLDVFQPTAYEIGRLWQQNLFTVAQEHLATAIIERQMGELHRLFRPVAPRPHTLVIGCVAEEFHRLGPRMVADFFEKDGWTVHYLGAAVPSDTFVALAREMQADLIGVSAQMVFHVPTILELVQELDRCGMGGLPVMAGGLPFVQQPDLYQSLGVRFAGLDARAAVSQANALLP